MQGIISASNNGRFRVAPDAGNELIRIFEDFQNTALRTIRSDMYTLKTRTPLGDSPAGQAIADFNAEVAAGCDGRSYEELITKLQEQVPQVVEAIRKGIEDYQDVDEGNATDIGAQD